MAERHVTGPRSGRLPFPRHLAQDLQISHSTGTVPLDIQRGMSADHIQRVDFVLSDVCQLRGRLGYHSPELAYGEEPSNSGRVQAVHGGAGAPALASPECCVARAVLPRLRANAQLVPAAPAVKAAAAKEQYNQDDDK